MIPRFPQDRNSPVSAPFMASKQEESMQTVGAEQRSSPNYRIEDLGANLCITIPPPNPAAVGCLVGAIYLVSWAIGGLFLAGFVRGLNGTLVASTGFASLTGWLLWLILFAGFTASLIFNLWGLLNREVVEITPGSISVARQFLGLGWRTQGLAEQIRALRVVRAPWWSSLLGRSFWRRNWFSEWFQGTGWNPYGARRYALEMDSGDQIIRFGEGLSKAEAKAILDLIQSRYAL
ncbi:MAG TPA: hypothetical protein VN363_00115 [Anaerolineales bacterium]|nr:hypothetical protein [Anaerolineales bacterium]